MYNCECWIVNRLFFHKTNRNEATMKIYRCITAYELTNIYTGNPKRLPAVVGENTHHYRIKERYIHFFKYSQSAQFYFSKFNNSKTIYERVIAYMIAYVPDEILQNYFGYGFYGYTDENNCVYNLPLPEYALPLQVFQSDFILEINNYIDKMYLSNEEEYQNYLEFVKTILNKYNYDEFATIRELQHYDFKKLESQEVIKKYQRLHKNFKI